MRATIYTRLSQDREGQTSIGRQEADCRAWVERHGGTVAHVRSDLGLSGFSGIDRPSFREALEDLTSGRSDVLVVWKLDRLSRQGIGQLGALLDDLERTGGRLVALHDGIDTAQAGSRIVVAILAELARAESANTGMRTRSAKARLADAGKWSGGRPPFGYAIKDSRLILDPETAPVARELAERAAQGETLVSIARDLNARGLRGFHGGTWSSSKVAGILRSPAMVGWFPRAGRRPHRGEDGEPVSVTDDPLLTVAEWRATIDAINGRRPTGFVGRPPSFLLTGRIRCGRCGRPMSSNGSPGTRSSAYRCRRSQEDRTACQGNTIAQGTTDAYVARRLLLRFAVLEPGDPLLDAVARRWVSWKAPEVDAERSLAEEELADLEGRLAHLEDSYYVRSEMSADRFRELSARLRADRDRAAARVTKITVPEVDLGALMDPETSGEAWAAATLEDRRAVLGLAVERIIIAPSGRVTTLEERITVEWAG